MALYRHNRANIKLLLLIFMLGINVNCHRRLAPVTPTAPSDNNYVDLTRGHSLSITVPYFSSGGYTAKLSSVKEDQGTLTVSDAHLIGFQVSRYAIRAEAKGRVRLQFQSADTTTDGKTRSEDKKPELPFRLPPGGVYSRLIFFVRSSQADHNMAIAASKYLNVLNAFGSLLMADPSVCGKVNGVFCVWVPSGIAVRQE